MDDELYFALRGTELLARGELEVVAVAMHRASARECGDRLSLYLDRTGAPTDVDLSGSKQDVIERVRQRLAEANTGETPRRGPGRPKLGVVSREVSLLPRHWQWLSAQKGGASATLRRLVEEARKRGAEGALVRSRVEAAHRFMWDIAGDLPGFEEASRALFSHEFEKFERLILAWPVDIQSILARYVGEARVALSAQEASA